MVMSRSRGRSRANRARLLWTMASSRAIHQPRLAGLDKLTTPRLSVEMASKLNAPSFLMCRGGRSADTGLATDILSVKAVPVDFGTFTPIQDGKQPNTGKCESHRE
jgi:hypothetical protein